MAISKIKIRLYKTSIEKEIRRVRKKQRECTKNEDWDTLKELYLKEEYLNGELHACKYILKNC